MNETNVFTSPTACEKNTHAGSETGTRFSEFLEQVPNVMYPSPINCMVLIVCTLQFST